MERRYSRTVNIGTVRIGGGERIAVQSMTNTPTCDTEKTIEQISHLRDCGCDIVRVTVPTAADVESIYKIKCTFPDYPLVADIHFDYRIALGCIDAGIDKIRINPGNIGDSSRIKAVACAAASRKVPIRIGVNGGSVEKHILEKYNGPTAQALAQSAMYHVSLLERYDFDNIVISVKSSDTQTTIDANKTVAQLCSYPLHLGVTEAGTYRMGCIKNAVGIGSLLSCGIGDTVRVSLTDKPEREVQTAHDILQSLGLHERKITVISCPTCGRTRIDIIALAEQFDAIIPSLKPSRPLKVALMGCAVNGPGEAREADIGIAGGSGEAVLIKHGEVVRKLTQSDILKTLIEEINKM